MKFVKYFFAETESLWSQGPVTRDFLNIVFDSAEIFDFKHFCVCSASDEIHSAYAQPAMKFVLRMLSVQ